MLREKWLNRVSLIVAVCGVIIIVFYSVNIEPLKVNVFEINENLLEQNVLIEGRIDSSYLTKNVLIFELNDGTGKIKAVKFSPEKNDLLLIHKNAFLRVEGRVTLYKNEIEIIVETVENV